jgi:hypothetical protein
VRNDRYYEEINKGHGRHNERYYRLLPIIEWLSGMEQWEDIQSVVEVARKRTFRKKMSKSNRNSLITSPR